MKQQLPAPSTRPERFRSIGNKVFTYFSFFAISAILALPPKTRRLVLLNTDIFRRDLDQLRALSF